MSGGGESTRPVRVGVVVSRRVVPAWITSLMEDIAASPELRLAAVWIGADERRTDGRVAELDQPGATISLLDECLFGRRAPLLMPVSLDSWAVRHGVVLSGLCGAGLCAGVLPGVETPGECMDVVLDFSETAGIRVDPSGASAAIWRLRGVSTGEARSVARSPELVAAVLGRTGVVAFELCARASGDESTRLLKVARCATHPSSPIMTGAYLAASAWQLIVVRLRNSTHESLRQDVSHGSPTRQPPKSGSAARGTGPRQMAPRIQRTARAESGLLAACSHIAGVAASQARKVVFEKEWRLLIGSRRLGDLVPDPSLLESIAPPPGRFWADPFAVVCDGRTHVYFEEYVHAQHRGRIAVATLDEQGRPGRVSTALESDTHLSYPCVFLHEGRLFMIPENAGSGRLDLYECTDLPGTWTRRRTLIRSVRLVDASLVEWHGLWWMFASLLSPPGTRTAELLLLYSAEDPVKGEWREHPRNPILADVSNARPAGAPFIDNGRLYRLAQDGTRGYGWAISVNEVLSLTPTDFVERRLGELRPTWDRRLCGVHTLNFASDTVVMDVCHYVPRQHVPRPSDPALSWSAGPRGGATPE